jgi:hypothetical protein
MLKLTRNPIRRKHTRTSSSTPPANCTMAFMNGMIAGKILRIKRMMGKAKLKIIAVEMETAMGDHERNSDKPNGTVDKPQENALTNEAGPAAAEAQTMKRKFTSFAITEKRKKTEDSA